MNANTEVSPTSIGMLERLQPQTGYNPYTPPSYWEKKSRRAKGKAQKQARRINRGKK